jgi:hypothetical protein
MQEKPSMKKLFASILCLALVFGWTPIEITAAGRQTGQIAGTAVVEGNPLANVSVRLRNVDTGQLVGSTTTNAQGQFNFANLPAGNFVVETVGPNGAILGTSATVALTPGAMVAGAVTVSTTAAAAAAAGIGGAAAGGAAATGGAAAGGGFFGTTAGILTLGAIGAAAVGVTLAVTGS